LHTHVALESLRDFRAMKKLQQAAMTFIVSQLASREEMDALQKAFKSLDISKTGVLTREELMIGYRELMGDLAEAEVERIMKIADHNNTGAITYSDWVIATINKNKILSDDKMKQAFELFDADGNGTISALEIKEVLGIGKKFDERIWDDIVVDADVDGDGVVSYDEFKTMMEKLLSDVPIEQDLSKSTTIISKNTKS